MAMNMQTLLPHHHIDRIDALCSGLPDWRVFDFQIVVTLPKHVRSIKHILHGCHFLPVPCHTPSPVVFLHFPPNLICVELIRRDSDYDTNPEPDPSTHKTAWHMKGYPTAEDNRALAQCYAVGLGTNHHFNGLSGGIQGGRGRALLF